LIPGFTAGLTPEFPAVFPLLACRKVNVGFSSTLKHSSSSQNKTRICINVSLPEGRSFNDNIEKSSLEKIRMASARQFGQMLIEAGRNSTMAKPDIVDAYIGVPGRDAALDSSIRTEEGSYLKA
jgi:hypothetical protein